MFEPLKRYGLNVISRNLKLKNSRQFKINLVQSWQNVEIAAILKYITVLRTIG